MNVGQREKETQQRVIKLFVQGLGYTYLGNDVHIVKENNQNIKITTPEDFYMLKAMLELEENRCVFGL